MSLTMSFPDRRSVDVEADTEGKNRGEKKCKTGIHGWGELQRCIRAAKSRKKSSRQRLTVFAP